MPVMGVLSVCAALFIMVVITVCSLPLSYEVRLVIGTPFTLHWKMQWLGHAFYYEWDYEAGKPPQKKCFLRWRDYYREKRYEEWLSRHVKDAIGSWDEGVWDELEKESQDVTYDSLLKGQAAKKLRNQLKDQLWWWPLVVNGSFGRAFGQFLLSVLFHSRIRQFYFEGSIGLPQPYETGMLSALLYAAIPANISNLNFNYTEEEYDCHGYANGRMYPVVLLVHILAFLRTKPMKILLTHWFKRRKEKDHG
jgi:hypothetical protein